jgi:hypothetical protein
VAALIVWTRYSHSLVTLTESQLSSPAPYSDLVTLPSRFLSRVMKSFASVLLPLNDGAGSISNPSRAS